MSKNPYTHTYRRFNEGIKSMPPSEKNADTISDTTVDGDNQKGHNVLPYPGPYYRAISGTGPGPKLAHMKSAERTDAPPASPLMQYAQMPGIRHALMPVRGTVNAYANLLQQPTWLNTGVGALAGLGTGYLLGRNQDRRGRNRRMLAGGLIGGLGLMAASHVAKSAAWGDGVKSKVMGDFSISAVQRQELLSQIDSLSPSQRRELSASVRSVAGAGVGAVIARKLLKWKPLPTGLAALAGATLFNAFSYATRSNQRQSNRDIFGRVF